MSQGRDKPKYVLCIAFSELGDLITGDSNGAITIWELQTGQAVKHVRYFEWFSICLTS
jgi:microtubule-associated protein-like 1/2